MQGLVAVGTSMGGMSALEKILPLFPNDFLWPIAVVQHRHSDSDKYFLSDLAKRCVLKVCEAEDKQPALPGTIYFAPSGYHLFLERPVEDQVATFALSMGLFERYARPSIDVFFDSVACALGSYALGIILTGNLSDGAEGLGQIMKCGGYALVEDPLSAEKSEMPKAAIARLKPHQILPAHEMAPFVIEYVREFASQQERNNSNV